MQKPTVYDIVSNPDAFIHREPGNYMPPWKGILLAWLVKELKKPADLFLIESIRVRGKVGYQYYKFCAEDFLFETQCDYDEIGILHRIGLDRFEMKSGAFYEFVQTDGEYRQDELHYHGPVIKENLLRQDFDLLPESVKK